MNRPDLLSVERLQCLKSALLWDRQLLTLHVGFAGVRPDCPAVLLGELSLTQRAFPSLDVLPVPVCILCHGENIFRTNLRRVETDTLSWNWHRRDMPDHKPRLS